jgi:hypothetical protein
MSALPHQELIEVLPSTLKNSMQTTGFLTCQSLYLLRLLAGGDTPEPNCLVV